MKITATGFKKFLRIRSYLLLVITAGCYIASKVSDDYFILDLLDHFQVYYWLAFFIIFLVGFFYLKEKIIFLVSLFFLFISLLITLIPLAPYLTLSEKNNNNNSVKIVSVNLNYKNTRYENISSFIEQENPDILVIIELSIDQSKSLSPLLDKKFPHQYQLPTDNPTGIGLFSRFKIDNPRYIDPTGVHFGFISSNLWIDNKKYQMILAHPFPPVHQDGLIMRKLVFAEIIKQLGGNNEPAFVIGDLNNTLWSDDFLMLLKSLSLKANIMAPATWPNIFAFPKIGIDHILIPQDAMFRSIRRGPDIGSDHYPLIAEVYL